MSIALSFAIKGGEIVNNPRIRISKSAYGTTDVIIYDMPNPKMVDWFSLVDVWGSKGYDRFHDDGLYFELPREFYDIIEKLPFVSRNCILVDKK